MGPGSENAVDAIGSMVWTMVADTWARFPEGYRPAYDAYGVLRTIAVRWLHVC
jgi:hypothetical protein